MIQDFLSPVSVDFDSVDYRSAQLGSFIQRYGSVIPDFEEGKCAIIGVNEWRGAGDNRETSGGANAVREQLYKLYTGRWGFEVFDLGDVIPGDTWADTEVALRSVVGYLLKNNVIPIIIGGSQDLTLPIYRGFEVTEQNINIASIDSTFDLGLPNESMSNRTYLSRIILEKPNRLYNFSNLGYQTYFIHPDEVDLMDKMYFEAYRLGHLQNDIREAEPVVRDADFVGIDMRAIRLSESPGVVDGSPNGFYGAELCAMARYSGMSDKCMSFGLFEYRPDIDWRSQTAALMAQAIWYFFEGVSLRYNDYPFGSRDSYLKYHVELEDQGIDMVFHKSDKSGRWWMEVPIEPNLLATHQRHTLVPCSYQDYVRATEGELPDRWMRAFKRMT
jgi:formiminoglutamase